MLLILLLLIGINALLAMSEMALVSLRKARLQKYIDKHDKGAIAAAQLAENPATFLSSIQVGITLIAIVSGMIGEDVFAPRIIGFFNTLGYQSDAIKWFSSIFSVAIITYLSIFMGELTPKRIGQLYPEQIARVVSRPLAVFSNLMHPVVVFLAWSTNFAMRIMRIRSDNDQSMTDEELNAIFTEGTQTGLLDEQERMMLKNVIRLDLRPISSIMVPRSDMVWLSTADSQEETIKTVLESEHSRFPVCGDSLDQIIGLTTAKHVFQAHLLAQNGAGFNIGDNCLEPLYILESLDCLELVNVFKEASKDIAMVVDEYGDIQGIVTKHDLLAVIAGEFGDQASNHHLPHQHNPNNLVLDRLISKHDLQDLLRLKELPDEEHGNYQTLSGLLMYVLGSVPKVGDHIVCDNWLLCIEQMDGHRIEKVRATKQES